MKPAAPLAPRQRARYPQRMAYLNEKPQPQPEPDKAKPENTASDRRTRNAGGKFKPPVHKK